MAAAVAAGVYPDFEQAAKAMVAIERLVEPNPANAAVYDDLFGEVRRAVSAAQCLA